MSGSALQGGAPAPTGPLAVVIWLAAIFLTATSAHTRVVAEERQSEWIVTIGSYVIRTPLWNGSNSHFMDWRPVFDFRKSDEKEWLELPGDGFGIALFETTNFRMGPLADWRFSPHGSSVCANCLSVGSHDLAVESGLFAEYWPANWMRTRVEVRTAVIRGAGSETIASSDLVWGPSPRWIAAVGPRITISDAAFVLDQFGARAINTPFDRASRDETSVGVHSIGFGLNLFYQIDEHWRLMGSGEWQHATGSAVERLNTGRHSANDGFSLGIGASRTFTIGDGKQLAKSTDPRDER